MFSGTQNATLDEKGRFTLPSSLRAQLPADFSSKLKITVHPSEPCLLIYTKEEWTELADNMANEEPSTETRAAFIATFIYNAADVEIDRNGRMLIPPLLREYAQLERSLHVRGHFARIEVWNETAGAQDEERRRALLRSPQGAPEVRTYKF